MLNLEIMKQAVMDSRDGITISDNCAEDNPLIFVNPAFERMTGYSFEEITNVNCRYLQNNGISRNLRLFMTQLKLGNIVC